MAHIYEGSIIRDMKVLEKQLHQTRFENVTTGFVLSPYSKIGAVGLASILMLSALAVPATGGHIEEC